jgi:hypothetical protein
LLIFRVAILSNSKSNCKMREKDRASIKEQL